MVNIEFDDRSLHSALQKCLVNWYRFVLFVGIVFFSIEEGPHLSKLVMFSLKESITVHFWRIFLAFLWSFGIGMNGEVVPATISSLCLIGIHSGVDCVGEGLPSTLFSAK